ncbi:hypothetical protein ACJJTC_017934 [Scirpophaga incertulas]
MEDSNENRIVLPSSPTSAELVESAKNDTEIVSQSLIANSPVYEPEEDIDMIDQNKDETTTADQNGDKHGPNADSTNSKRKLCEESNESKTKIKKLDLIENDDMSNQILDDEVREITSSAKRKFEDPIPSASRIRTPVRSSPRKIAKRSNSVDEKTKTPKTPKSRSASADITKARKTPRKPLKKSEKSLKEIQEIQISDEPISRPSVQFISEILPIKEVIETIADESSSELNDSQNFHLVLSPTPEKMEGKSDDNKSIDTHYNSDPVIVKDRKEILTPGRLPETHSEGYNYSDQSNNLSQPQKNYSSSAKATDQESTDSIGSLNLESPDHLPTVTSKLISKLSNGDSSTPTESLMPVKQCVSENSDSTPDLVKINGNSLKTNKNESFRVSNTTTPSTISPLQNGHSLPINTPQIPVFDVHVSNNEDCEFLSLYIVRTDNDLGMDMCKEYQRISKRFTIDPYLADVSVSNSPSSVTSGGMINLHNRTSFASTVSSSTSSTSNRTSDGTFVVPQPPRKSYTNPTTSVKGYDALMKKLQEIFSHIRESSVEDTNRSIGDDKVSVGIQTSISSDSANISNGNASPEEVGKCDKATPKSSLKKARVRGRRHMAGKTKRAILPTQHEEPELMHGINSPEMIPSNGNNGKESPIKSPKEEKANIVATPKSVSKLKQKRRPISPRPVTPVEKGIVKTEYPGYAPETVVLAKWADKRYYSGKVMEITEPNKYLIKFDDGQTKVLLDDFIIFGDMKILPLQGQSVFALVDEEQNYEPGLVLGVEENICGTVTYKCTTDGDTLVMVTASELYLSEDQARSLKESLALSPSTPTTPRRRHNRELDLDNIIQGPRSARTRDKANSSGRKRVASPKSPKASTSGVKSQAKSTPVSRKRLASESSEMSESSNSAPPIRLEDVSGVEPEVQRTPRKIDGVKAGPLQLKGAAKQNIGKKNSKLTKFENDEQTIQTLGPIPTGDNKLFAGLHFLLTCNDTPRRTREATNDGKREVEKSQSHYSSEEDGETNGSMCGTDTEDLVFCDRPFNKERLKEQIEAGGGKVYSHFDDVPSSAYSSCRLVAPRPCLTAKYIQCLAAGIRAVSHGWLIAGCAAGKQLDVDAFLLPAGWSLLSSSFCPWVPPSGKRNTAIFKDKLLLLCSDQDSFLKFWERVCTLAGANTRIVHEDELNMNGALALVTEWDCPHVVQNKANQDNIAMVSTHWVIQCLIENRVIDTSAHAKFSFAFTEQE